MHIVAIALTNWMAYRGRQELTLPACPIALVGRHDGDPRRSNWTGKTAFLEAIEWCLSGTHRKRTEDALIHHGEREMSVELVFSDDTSVVRTRPMNGPTRFHVQLCAPIGETYQGDAAVEMLGRILRMDHEDRAVTVNFGQSDIEAIVGMRAGERRRVVSRWLELDMWDRAAKVARERMRDALGRVDVLRAAMAAIPAASMTPEQIERERVELRAAVEKLRPVVEAGATAQRELIEVRSRANVDDLNRQLADVTQRGRAAKAHLDSLGAPVDDATFAMLEDEVSTTGADLAAVKNRVRELGSIRDRGFSGACPVLPDFECPAKLHIGATIDQHAYYVEEAWARHKELAELHRDARAAVEEEQRKARDRAAAAARYDELRQQYATVRASRDAAVAAAGAIDTTALERAAATGREAEAELSEATSRLRYLDHVERDASRYEVLRAERQVELAAAERRAKIMTVVASALGPRGIPQRIASTQLGQLEERANAILQGTGLSFTIGWDRETKEISPTCNECGHAFKTKREKACPACGAARGMKRADDLEFLVDDGSGEIEDVRAKSGGARVLVASSIRLGGGMMLRELRGSPVAWAVVDEPFGALDVENKGTLARMFASMLGSVGLEQAFVVSHDYALLEAMPARIVVNRADGASTLSIEV